LTEVVRRKPYSVILLDEIEKAHPDTFNILLQVLDEGKLTDSKGRLADFKNSIIIMTSNIGSDEIKASFETNSSFEVAELEAKEKVMGLLKSKVRPEFLNRIDDLVVFSPLTRKEIQLIVLLQLRKIQERLRDQKINLITTDESVIQLAKLGFDPVYGGRPVKRVLQQQLLNPLSKELLSSNLDLKKKVVFDFIEPHFIFRNSNT